MEKLSPTFEYLFGVVKEYVSLEDFLEIFQEFDKYDDHYKKDIPYNVVRLIDMSNRITFKESLLDGLNLVLSTTIIELLTTWKDYIRFDDWFNLNKEKYEKKCIRAWHKYNSIYGKRKSFRTFFIALEKKEKLELLSNIKKQHKGIDGLRNLCFQGGNCIYDKFTCNYKVTADWCPAFNDDKILNKGIKILANHLYDFRSLFVHEAWMPRFASDPQSLLDQESSEYVISLKTTVMYLMREEGKLITYSSELYAKDFFELVMNNLLKMMRKYLKNVKS